MSDECSLYVPSPLRLFTFCCIRRL